MTGTTPHATIGEMSEILDESQIDKHPIDTRPIAAYLLNKDSSPNWFAAWRDWHYQEKWSEQTDTEIDKKEEVA